MSQGIYSKNMGAVVFQEVKEDALVGGKALHFLCLFFGIKHTNMVIIRVNKGRKYQQLLL